MTPNLSQIHPVRLCSYAIASGDMYYSEMEQRDIYAWEDPQLGFRIWGEIHGLGPATSVDLCQMLLEYAMYLRSWCSPTEAEFNMKDFGERLGLALVRLFKETPPVRMQENPAACALLCVLESMKAQLTIQQVGPELHFLLAQCPLEEVARKTGLRETELAHIGVNSLVQTLVHSLDQRQSVGILETSAKIDYSLVMQA